MPPVTRRPGPNQLPIPGQEPHPALVHVLTPEFQNIDPADFADIPDEYVRYTHPDVLRSSLFETPSDGRTVVSYQAPTQEWVRLVVTPREFKLLSRHIPMLAKTAMTDVYTARDNKLQDKTGDPSAKARTDQDHADAKRAAMRSVMQKEAAMAPYLQTEIIPRIQLIAQFTEMTVNHNLARGTNQTVKERVERLRTFVFGDMLDAIGNQREWNEAQATLAVRTLQKRLYLDPDKSRRVTNFAALLQLAEDYYGHKRALILDRIAQARKYQRDHPDVVADVIAKDEERKIQPTVT